MVLILIENWKALTFHRESVIPPPQRLFIDRFATITLRAWQTRTHFCKHIVACDVSWARKRAGHKMNVVFPCCANWETFVADKMFLNKIRNIFCVQHTQFVSATNIARAGKRGNICVGNSVSSFARAFIKFLHRSRENTTVKLPTTSTDAPLAVFKAARERRYNFMSGRVFSHSLARSRTRTLRSKAALLRASSMSGQYLMTK